MLLEVRNLQIIFSPAGGEQRSDINGAHDEDAVSIGIVLCPAEIVGRRYADAVSHCDGTVGQ
jgi:hypothetical protein